MLYYLGQAFGLVATILCFIMPLFKKKWQILFVNGFVNVFFALNLLLIDQIGTGIIMNCVAIAQTVVSFWHLKKNTTVTKLENIIFFLLYVGLGSLGFSGPLDILPIIAAVFNMLAIFQPDEQKTRVLIFLNASTYFSYYCALGATSMFAELLAAVTAVIGLIKYRKKK